MKDNLKIKKATIISKSMKPLLDISDEAIVELQPHKNIRFGDIILFKTLENRQMVHRVIFMHNGLCIQKGDNSIVGYCINIKKILGKVVAIRKIKNNKIINLNKQPWPIINFLLSINSFLQFIIFLLPSRLFLYRNFFMRK